MQPKRFALFSAFTLAILLVSLVSPAIALADEATPPPAEPSTEVTPVDAPADPVPAGDEAALEETDAAPTEEADPTEAAPTEPAPVEPAPDVEEVLDSLPEETAIVALDAEGDALPLASVEAAQVIVSGDPMWCPDGVLPGGVGCTIGHPSFAALLADLADFSESGPGTIYIASDYDAGAVGNPDAGSDIVFDYGANALSDLVIQGGWNFDPLVNAVVGTSTIDLGANNTLDFWDWGAFGVPGFLTLRDLVIASGGLYIGDSVFDPLVTLTTANVTLENVTVTNAEENAYIQTTGSVSATNSSFDDNLDDGLVVIADGDITLNNVTANGNDGIGADLDTLGAVSITNGGFSGNTGTGLLVLSGAGITLNNVTANGNNTAGADLADCGCLAGTISITNSTFNGNAEGGLSAFTDGDVNLNIVSANGNGATGVLIENGGSVSLSQVVASGNTDVGIDVGAGGNITATGVTANGNDLGGALLETCNCLAGSVTVSDSEFFVNDSIGLAIFSNGNVTIDNVDANGNIGPGIIALSGGDVTISTTDTFGNADAGMLVESYGNVTLTGLNSGYNGDIGVGVGSAGNVSVANSWFGFNDSVGFGVENYGNVTLVNSAFFDNVDPGAYVMSDGSVSISNSFFGNCFFGPSLCEDQPVGLIVDSLGPVDISNSQFNQNAVYGLEVWSDGDVLLNNVTANENGLAGAFVMTPGKVKVCGGSYSYNDRFGITATAATVFMSDQTLLVGNGDLPFDLGPGTTFLTYNCALKKPGDDYKLVKVSDGQSVEIDCEEGLAGIELHLPNGDSLIVPCPMRGPASLSGLAFDQLPAGLPDGFTFVSALEAQAARDGLTVSFMMPSPDVEYTVLRWNGAGWVELDGATTVDGMLAVVPVSPGIYVLAIE